MTMAATAACADGVPLTFFDENSRIRTLDDSFALQLMERTGVTIGLAAPPALPVRSRL